MQRTIEDLLDHQVVVQPRQGALHHKPWTWNSSYTYICMYVYIVICIHLCVCKDIYMSIYVLCCVIYIKWYDIFYYLYLIICMHRHTYIHIYIYKHTCIFIHTYLHSHRLRRWRTRCGSQSRTCWTTNRSFSWVRLNLYLTFGTNSITAQKSLTTNHNCEHQPWTPKHKA